MLRLKEIENWDFDKLREEDYLEEERNSFFVIGLNKSVFEHMLEFQKTSKLNIKDCNFDDVYLCEDFFVPKILFEETTE